MKRLAITIAFLLGCVSASAQYDPYTVYTLVAGNPTLAPAGSGPVLPGGQPPSILCYTLNTSGQVVPCDFSGGGSMTWPTTPGYALWLSGTSWATPHLTDSGGVIGASEPIVESAGGSVGSADTGTPKFTFGADSISANQPVTAPSFGTNGTTPGAIYVAGNSPYPSIVMTPVWNRQGPITFTSNPCSVYGELSVIQDTNSQLLGLASSTVVFKATGTATAGICYAESLNGITGWVSSSTVILSGFARSQLVLNGGVYYVYAVPMPAANEISVYTANSAANLAAGTLTLQKANAIALGSSGAWDATVLATGAILVDGATWRMCYQGGGTNSTGFFAGQQSDFLSGMATSSDGINWTKYAGNPVMGINGQFAAQCNSLLKDPTTGLYWIWAHLTYPGVGVGDLPTDIGRFESADAQTWTQNPANTFTFPRVAQWEGARNPGGQVANPTVVQVGTSTYLWNSYTYQQNGPGGIEVSTTPLTLHQLVSTDEGGTINYTALAASMATETNNWWSQMKVGGALNLSTVGCVPYINFVAVPGSTNPATQSSGLGMNCNLSFDATHLTWAMKAGATSTISADHQALFSIRAGATSLVNGSGFTPSLGLLATTTGVYSGIWNAGDYTSDTYFGKDATTDDFIVTTANKATPVELFRLDVSTNQAIFKNTVEISNSTAADTLGLLNIRNANWTSLVNGSGFVPSESFNMASSTYAGFRWQGIYTNDSCLVKDATDDDLIFSTCDTSSPSQMLKIGHTGLVSIGTGTNVVYRCATAGATLPTGSLTIASGACGSTTDTGLRVQ